MLRVSPDEAKNLLTNLPPGVRIELKPLPTGGFAVFAVPEREMTKDDILKEKYTALVGQPITVSEAAQKYDIHRRTIFKWIDKGYIAIVQEEPVKQVDEAEVKYCVDIYRQRKSEGFGIYGAPLLDKNGLPYQLKRPDVAEYRRRKNQEQ